MSERLTLVVLAAGMGSRFGGVKQIEPVGPNGERILDYSVYDAVRAGFDRVVFVIKRDIEEAFRKAVFDGLSARVDAEYVFQDMDLSAYGLPSVPARAKPWGTGHALLAAEPRVRTPFAVINADDFYGSGAFAALAGFLGGGSSGEYCMVGYKLANTLSEGGAVSRGVCEIGADGMLRGIEERASILRGADGVIRCQGGEGELELDGEACVSMNCWGLRPDVFPALTRLFKEFRADCGDILTSEFYLPTAVGRLVEEGGASVRALSCGERWFGFTYPGDKETVRGAIAERIGRGVYPMGLY